MAGNSTISIAFKLDGDDRGFRELAKSADGLKAAMTGSLSVADKLSGRLVNFAAIATGVQAASRAFSQLEGAMKGLTDAYAVQQGAETKLQQVMTNRMGATLEEVDAVKELAAEQQRLGVISDEVQLAGAQQMAVYLGEKDSISTLLPAMNDLIAQQEGLNATTGSAEAIAKAMGKAMEGQVGSLQRLGVTFTDAQAKVMQFGTEEERAAVLADVIESSVGGMNVALAQTDSGKQAQLANKLGDIREHLGAMMTGYMPFVTMAAQAGQAAASVTTLASGFVTLTKKIISGTVAFAKHTAAIVSNTAATVAQRAASLAASAAAKVWSGVQAVLNAILSANPIGIIVMAVAALVAAFVAAYKRCDKFREIVNKVWDVIKKFVGAIIGVYVKAFQTLISVVKSVVDCFGKLLGFNGKRVAVAVTIDSPDYKADAESLEDIQRNIKILQGMMSDASKGEKKWIGEQISMWNSKAQAIRRANAAAAEDNSAVWHAECLSIQDVDDNLAKLQSDLKSATTDEARAEANALIERYDALKKRMESMGKASKDSSKVWHDECRSIREVDDNLSILQERYDTATTQGLREETYALIQSHEALKKSFQEVSDAVDGSTRKFDENAKSIRGMRENVEYWRDVMEGAEDEVMRNYAQGNMSLWQDMVDDMEGAAAGALVVADEMSGIGFDANASTLEGYTANVSYLQDMLQTASLEEAAWINKSIAYWNEKASAVRDAGKEEEKAVMKASDAMRKGYAETKNLAGGIQGISDALTDSSSVWDMITGVIDGFLQIFDSFSAVIEIIKSLTAATKAQGEAAEIQGVQEATAAATAASAKAAEAGADIAEGAAAEVAATGEMTLAASETFAAHASIPWVGIAMGAVMVASMLATLLSLPKLAAGGIASGPSLALVGEYSGASSNPEVIAPLDRLRSMLRTDDDRYGQVEFRIEGRTLVGVLNKVNNLSERR